VRNACRAFASGRICDVDNGERKHGVLSLGHDHFTCLKDTCILPST
jgi:hypothetical protein